MTTSDSGLDAEPGPDIAAGATVSRASVRLIQDKYLAFVAGQSASESSPTAIQTETHATTTDTPPAGDAADAKQARLTGFGGFLIVILILEILIALGAGLSAIVLSSEGADSVVIAYWAWQFVFAVIYIALMLSRKRAARWYAIVYHLGAQIGIALIVFGPAFFTSLEWAATGGGGVGFAVYWCLSKRVKYTYTR